MGQSVETCFECDAMLGGLARWLRAAGYDASWKYGIHDHDLIRLSQDEGRTLLSSDSKIFLFRVIRDGNQPALFVPLHLTPLEQLGYIFPCGRRAAARASMRYAHSPTPAQLGRARRDSTPPPTASSARGVPLPTGRPVRWPAQVAGRCQATQRSAGRIRSGFRGRRIHLGSGRCRRCERRLGRWPCVSSKTGFVVRVSSWCSTFFRNYGEGVPSGLHHST